jgi:hypothetical protein
LEICNKDAPSKKVEWMDLVMKCLPSAKERKNDIFKMKDLPDN